MAVHKAFTKQIHTISQAILDFYYDWASSPPGYLWLILTIRFAVLIIMTINFGYLFSRPETNFPVLKIITMAALWFYFFFVSCLLVLGIVNRDIFESLGTQRSQVIVDSVLIAYLYWLSAHINGEPDSYIFLFYFLPLLVTARFLPMGTLGLQALYILLASVLVWFTQIPVSQLGSWHYWFSNLLPQLGFLFVLTVFYLIYYRRRKMGERLQTMALQLEEWMGHLWQGWFSVDAELRVTSLDTALNQRHVLPQDKATCAEVFCQAGTSESKSCLICPVKRAMDTGESIEDSEIEFIDRNGAKYTAQIAVHPILDSNHQITGAGVWVRDLNERKLFQNKQRIFTEDLERVIDQNRQEDRAHVQILAQKLDAISQASESALSTDLFRGADEIVRAIVLLLGCSLATVHQMQTDEETGREWLSLRNHFGIDERDIERASVLELNSASQIVKAFKTGEDQYVEDLQHSGLINFEYFSRSYNLRSMACFPLKIQGNIIGTFTLFRNRKQGFTEEDRQLGRALSNIMATLVANQRQFARSQQEAQRRIRELDILSGLSQRLVTIEDRNVLAQLIADIVRNELHAETSAVFVRQDDFLHRIALSGIEPDWFMEEAYQIGQGITGRVAIPESGQLFGSRRLENDVENCNMVVPENLSRYSQVLRSGSVKHLLAVPLNGLEGTFGVLRVVNKLAARGELSSQGFTEQEAELMTTIACIVAVAMENARSFETEKEKHILDQALRQGTRILTSTLEEDEILSTILAQLGRIVQYDTASLFLWEGDGLTLKSMAGFTPREREVLRHIRLDPSKNPPFIRMQTDHKPILINDLKMEPLLEPIEGTSRIRSWIGAPLVIKDQIIGWLSVDSWTPDKFTKRDVEIAEDFAQQAAIAIDNARQYKLRKEQVESLLRLDQYLVEITTATNKNATMNIIARAASELMGCEMAGVALYDKEKNEIHALPGAGAVGVSQEYIQKFSFPLDHTGGKVLLEKRVYQTRDASMDPDSIFGRRLIDPIGAKGVIAAPLMIGDFVVGILYAASYLPKDWSDFQLAFFSILSNHAAIAIRNSELFESKERRAQLLDLLHHLSIAGQLTHAPEVIYNILLTAVTAEYGLRFNRALLMLYDRENNTLKGFTGIGQLDNYDAYHIWEKMDDKSHSFEGYIEDVLNNGIYHYTALHHKAKNLEIPVRPGTKNVFARVFSSKKLEVVNPADEEDGQDQEFYRVFNANPFVVVPLLVNHEIVGILVVDNKMSGAPINPMELELLESCASQAAAAIYRSNLHQQLEDRVSILEHLQDLTRAFSELAEPREVLRQIADATIDVLHADIAYLAPYDQEKDELLVKDAVTAGARTVFQHEGTFSTYGLTSLAKQESSGLVIIEDLKSRKDLRSRFAEQEDVNSVAVCRLELRKKIVGMLYVNYRRHHSFSDMEFDTLRMLAGQAAVAIHNAQLHKQNEVLAAQRERNRLREDLHDVLNTYAFKVMRPAESIFERESRKRHRDLEMLEEADELWRFSRHSYQQLERILEDMRDPVLVERGLKVALGLLVKQSKSLGASLSIVGDVRPSADVELALYRICQEAISNIQKHAQLPKNVANGCNITLELETDRSRLLVQDFGVGFDLETIHDRKRRMGIQAMENWARKVGAKMNIRSTPGKGTSLEVIVPNPVGKRE